MKLEETIFDLAQTPSDGLFPLQIFKTLFEGVAMAFSSMGGLVFISGLSSA